MMEPLYFRVSKRAGEAKSCGSRFLGCPALPERFNYPVCADGQGGVWPYTFVCQLNLEELASWGFDGLLPVRGVLSFFAMIDPYLGRFEAPLCIGGTISDMELVKVFYFPDDKDLRTIAPPVPDSCPFPPTGWQMSFTRRHGKLQEDHGLFVPPVHRPWETWDPPFEDWQILLQVDSEEGNGFQLNFMDCGVLAFLIHPDDLARKDFSRVRAVVLSS